MDYPRVTEILRPFAEYSGVRVDVLEKAAQRGTKVHALCAAIARKAWLPDSMISEEFVPYVDAFKDWSACVDEFKIVEQRFIHEEYKYSGQVDFVVISNGRDVLVDIKTSSKPQKIHPLQMAAYMHVLASHGIFVQEAWLVYLKKEGGFMTKVVPYNPEEVKVFLAALDCWKYFHGEKIA